MTTATVTCPAITASYRSLSELWGELDAHDAGGFDDWSENVSVSDKLAQVRQLTLSTGELL